MRYRGRMTADAQAIQWDGTSAGLATVIAWLAEHGYEATLAVYDDASRIKVKIGLGSYLLVGRDDWAVVYDDGGIMVMTDPWFNAEYEVPQ